MNTPLASSAIGLLLTGVVVVRAVHQERLSDPLPTYFILFIAALCGDTIETGAGGFRRAVNVGQVTAARIATPDAEHGAKV